MRYGCHKDRGTPLPLDGWGPRMQITGQAPTTKNCGASVLCYKNNTHFTQFSNHQTVQECSYQDLKFVLELIGNWPRFQKTVSPTARRTLSAARCDSLCVWRLHSRWVHRGRHQLSSKGDDPDTYLPGYKPSHYKSRYPSFITNIVRHCNFLSRCKQVILSMNFILRCFLDIIFFNCYK